ncbi:gamma-glutamylcyclotransferase family protein [Desulfoscipio sp. XC116]|uniref:gamma-glutamylcyclotransferase family protein n=1 Tax=Desulfoscipio sp. XC116 TaxID=3144975 RepID=UPI00325A5894
MYLNRLFVFGTLLPGLTNYNRYLKSSKPKTFPATAKGIMYYLPEDGYPVITEGEGEVKGVIYESPDLLIILPEIDEIHKFTGIESQSDLIREIRDVVNLETGETVKAHMYLWPPAKDRWLKQNATVIADGDWLKFLHKHN